MRRAWPFVGVVVLVGVCAGVGWFLGNRNASSPDNSQAVPTATEPAAGTPVEELQIPEFLTQLESEIRVLRAMARAGRDLNTSVEHVEKNVLKPNAKASASESVSSEPSSKKE